MNKAPNFMIQYANYRIDCLWNCELMKPDIKNEKISIIDRAINAYQLGMITIDEAMKMINEA